jgi:hypothetical protein
MLPKSQDDRVSESVAAGELVFAVRGRALA